MLHQQVPAGGIELEVAWPVAEGGGDVEQRERARRRVDLKDRDAVVAAIGDVYEAPVSARLDFRRVVRAGEAVRHRAQRLHGGERTGGRVVREHSHSGREFIVDVCVAIGGMECDVARSAAGGQVARWRSVERQRPCRRVDAVHAHLIASEVSDIHATVRRRLGDEVRMRPLLIRVRP